MDLFLGKSIGFFLFKKNLLLHACVCIRNNSEYKYILSFSSSSRVQKFRFLNDNTRMMIFLVLRSFFLSLLLIASFSMTFI